MVDYFMLLLLLLLLLTEARRSNVVVFRRAVGLAGTGILFLGDDDTERGIQFCLMRRRDDGVLIQPGIASQSALILRRNQPRLVLKLYCK